MSTSRGAELALARWLLDADGARVIVRSANGVRTCDELRLDVAALVARLRTRPAGRWLVCTESAYECAVALLALWQVGLRAVLAPNLESGSLRELADGAQGVLGDRASGLAELASERVLDLVGERVLDSIDDRRLDAVSTRASRRTSDAGAWRVLAAHETVLELCTSGSTGARKVVAKTLAQLQAEIATLEHAFGAECADLRVLGTTSHQHIYGLLFRVLWPLCALREFHEHALVDPRLLREEIASGAPTLLVGSPAHLERLPELADLASLRARLRVVFSSGGPLTARGAERFARALGRAPIEVLGSTETGGIAWRRREHDASDSCWTPFDGVRIEIAALDASLAADVASARGIEQPTATSHAARSGTLRVHSAPAGNHGGVETGDAIELFADGRFALLGRADRIVKLFDERVSLTEIERRLEQHAWVESAAVLTLERGGATRIAAAVVLREAERARLASDEGRRRVIEALRAALRAYVRPTALPRAWRFAARLPQDAQGKRTLAALRQLFDAAPLDAAPLDTVSFDTSAASNDAAIVGDHARNRAVRAEHAVPRASTAREPAQPVRQARLVERESDDAHALQVVLEVPRDLWCLEGHFPDFPVVPGVVQLQWVVDWIRSWRGEPLDVARIEALKFKQLLQGGARFRLRVERDANDGPLRFRLWDERAEFSSGRLIPARPASASANTSTNACSSASTSSSAGSSANASASATSTP